MSSSHHEIHYVQRSPWLRAAVLGANDGIVSMGSLLVGLGSSGSDSAAILLAGSAALMAGTMSMAAGEYVSVSSQLDLERADLATERAALESNPQEELEELAEIYVERGLDADLAAQVAEQLMAHDALGAHARDELQLVEDGTRPLTAAGSSAISFAAGGVLPCLPAILVDPQWVVPAVVTAVAGSLTLLGATSARAGGASPTRAVLRIVSWGMLAMATTGGIGWLVGAAV